MHYCLVNKHTLYTSQLFFGLKLTVVSIISINMEPTIKIVNDPGRKSSTDRSSVCESYIVKANIDYQKQLEDLRTRLTEVETERTELENDNDKIETSQRYMRGILKNYYEIDQMNIDIQNKTQNVINAVSTPESILITFLLAAVLWLFSVHVLGFFINNVHFIILGILVFCVLVIAITYWLVFLPARKLQHNISAVQMEIHVIKKTNALLPDLFDNL